MARRAVWDMSYCNPRLPVASVYGMPQAVTGRGSCFCPLVEIVIPLIGSVLKDQTPFPQCVLAARMAVSIVVPSVDVSKSMYAEGGGPPPSTEFTYTFPT